jgi:rhodanese-related sulfurtransferase
MKRILALLVTLILSSSAVFAYDADLAGRFEEFYRPFDGKGCAKALQQIPAPAFIKATQAGERILVLDVRTPGEVGIYGMNLENSLAVPMSKVFAKETLDQIPTDGKVVVVCKSGARAMAVAMGLRQIGLKNVFVLKGGYGALTKTLSPKTAYR